MSYFAIENKGVPERRLRLYPSNLTQLVLP